ncbi:MAG: hypothetical protein KBC73_10020 [Burkholderiaceae bacterium]|nr:hypothetical protein [Burkholderiaceae bacterium]
MSSALPPTLPTDTDDRWLDLERWPRRQTFEFYRGFDKPYFNVCCRVDVAPLQAALAAAGPAAGGLSLACYHLTLRLAQAIEPFRYRLQGGRVRVVARLQASTAVLRDDDSLAFAYLPPAPRLQDFVRQARERIAVARRPQGVFDPDGQGSEADDQEAVLHFTTLPWVHFTSFSHARNWGREDAIPKFAFGRVDPDGIRAWMPMSVEVHHALMDGVQVGRFVEGFEAAVAAPEDWVGR